MVLKYTLSNYFYPHILDILAFVVIISSVLVIISKNPVVSVLFLICLFLTLSCYLLILGVTFIALSYLVVYVGAISILFLFILMLINIRTSEISTENKNSFSLAVIAGILFNHPVNKSLPLKSYNNNDYENMWFKKYFSYFVSSNIWDKNLNENLHITTIGNTLYTDFGILLIINSLILLLAMVGSIVITI